MYVEESEEFAVFNCVNLICFAALFSYYSEYNPLKRSPLFDNHESFRSGKIRLAAAYYCYIASFHRGIDWEISSD